jgi:hypothetical protein
MKHSRNFGSEEAGNLVFYSYNGNNSPGKEAEKIPERKTGVEQAAVQGISWLNINVLCG